MAPVALLSTVLDVGNHGVCVLPELYSDNMRTMVQLEISDKVLPTYTMTGGVRLPGVPPFATSLECFVRDAICSVYGFCNLNGTNNLKIRLENLCLAERVQLTTLPESIQYNTPAATKTEIPGALTGLAALLMGNDSSVQGTEKRLVLN